MTSVKRKFLISIYNFFGLFYEELKMAQNATLYKAKSFLNHYEKHSSCH